MSKFESTLFSDATVIVALRTCKSVPGLWRPSACAESISVARVCPKITEITESKTLGQCLVWNACMKIFSTCRKELAAINVINLRCHIWFCMSSCHTILLSLICILYWTALWGRARVEWNNKLPARKLRREVIYFNSKSWRIIFLRAVAYGYEINANECIKSSETSVC